MSSEGTSSPIGGLIGIMVEEEEDIGKVDVSSLASEAPAATPAKEATPEAPKTAATP